MSSLPRILKNTGVLFLSQVLSYAAAFFYTMVAARFLGPSDYGILTFALAMTNIFGVICDFGLQPLTTREVARDRSLAPKFLSNVSGIKMVLSSTSFGLVVGATYLMGYPKQTIHVVSILGLSCFSKAFSTMLDPIFQAHERMEYQALGHLLNSAFVLGGVLLAVQWNLQVTAFAAIYVFANAAVVVFGLLVLRSQFSEAFYQWSVRWIEVDWPFWRSALGKAFPFGIGMVFVMIFYWTDTIMLSLMKGDEVVGWYNAAYRLVLALLIVPNSLIMALYPVMSRYAETSQDVLRLTFLRSLKYLILLAVPAGMGTTLLAKKIVLAFYGEAYLNAVLPLQILIWSTVLIFLSQPFGNFFNSMNRQSVVSKTTGVCAGLNITLNLILIPRFSLIGASLATVATELISLVLLGLFCVKGGHKFPRIKEFLPEIFKILSCSTGMCVVILGLSEITLPILIPVAAMFYFGLLYLTGVIRLWEFFPMLRNRHQ